MRLAAKLGFTEVERFEAYGAEQWLGVWSSGPPEPLERFGRRCRIGAVVFVAGVSGRP